jgi:hypothetical protein
MDSSRVPAGSGPLHVAPRAAAQRRRRRAWRNAGAFGIAAALAACGGSDPEPRVTIESPAPASATQSLHFTAAESVRLAGTVSDAPFVRASNRTLNVTTEARIVYQGERGSWVADVRLEPGHNVILVTAFCEGMGTSATRRIDVTRLPR